MEAEYAPGQQYTEAVWREGPVTVLWGQPEWVDPDRPPRPAPPPRLPRVRGWIMRLAGWRAWRIDIRVVPPDGEDLEAFGLRIMARMPGSHRFPPIEDGHRAIWLACGGWAPDAGAALTQAARVFDWMQGIDLGSAQLRVQRAAS